jgi:two-component system sensor histidine kinase YesM
MRKLFADVIFDGLKKVLPNLKLTIRSKIILSFVIVIFMMGVLNAFLLFNSLRSNEQYDKIVTNITQANSINGIVKTSIDSVMWDIVAGKISFEEGSQYQIINSVNENIEQLMKNVSSNESRTRLEVTYRTMKTLKHYVDVIGEQIKQKKKVSDNEKVLEEIRGVSSLVEDNIGEFILYEIKSCEEVKKEVKESVDRWVLTNIIVFCIVFLFSVAAAWFISGSISKPIKELRKMTASIAEGNLNVRVENRNIDEIASLGMSFNIMAGKLKELIENSKKEQENLKKSELKALQAQINPHFLYNTLDTIVWMSEANKSEQVIEIVRALSNFFRITLSKGKDWISVRDELEHVRSYLIIQKIRYRDIMNFSMDTNEDILDFQILKLTLQPIVENALYHGIKNRRSGGSIIIKGSKTQDGKVMLFEVIDNGIGMTSEKLGELQAQLENDSIEPTINESGFGLNNVHKRIRLYYGKPYGLVIKSEFNVGTHVSILIPCER